MDIIAMKEKKLELIKEQRGLLDKADEEKRNLTDAETEIYKAIDVEIDKLDKDILSAEQNEARRKKLAEQEIEARKVEKKETVNISKRMSYDPEKEFKNIGEYFWAIAAEHYDHRSDPRLRELREQSYGTGGKGGFALPEQFKPEVWQVSPQEAIVKPRATVIPAGDPPDAKLVMPSLDQTSAENIYGGVVMTHTGEALTLTETDANLRQITMEPKKIAGYIVTTNELLTNWDAAASFITTQMQKARVGQEDYDFLRGDGINKSIGIVNSAAAITVTRAGSSAIAFADVYGMYARMKMGGSPVWLASQTTIPQLVTLKDAANNSIWVSGNYQGAAAAVPGTLMGIPLIYADRLPALGTKGDLILADLSYYLIKEGSGPDVAISTELLFLSDRVVFRLTWRVDGKPWLTEPLPLEGNTSTVSPFVLLSA